MKESEHEVDHAYAIAAVQELRRKVAGTHLAKLFRAGLVLLQL
jgi:hypothetical protein